MNESPSYPIYLAFLAKRPLGKGKTFFFSLAFCGAKTFSAAPPFLEEGEDSRDGFLGPPLGKGIFLMEELFLVEMNSTVKVALHPFRTFLFDHFSHIRGGHSSSAQSGLFFPPASFFPRAPTLLRSLEPSGLWRLRSNSSFASTRARWCLSARGPPPATTRTDEFPFPSP